MPLAALRRRIAALLEQPTRTFLQAVIHSETTRLMGIGALVGILGGLAAAAFDWASVAFGELLLASADPSMDTPAHWRRVVGPVLGGLAAGLLTWRLTRRRSPYGITDVIDGIANHRGHLSIRDGTVTALAATIALGGGQSGGREGPIVQLGASLSSRLCRWLHLPPSRARVLVAAGAAGGIAASFNTPLGGCFFALEILLGNFALESVAPVVASGVTGTMVGQALLGNRVALALPPFELQHPAELLIYPLLGILCGGVALLHKWALVAALDLRERVKIPPWAMPALAGLLVGILAAAGFPQIMGNGYAFLEELLEHVHHGVLFLLALLVVKALATAITFGGRAGLGIFAPTLFLGAVTGTLFGIGANHVLPTITEAPGAYGMVGMGAMMAAVAHGPITMTLMLFEMTGNYAVVPPLLLTLAVAGVVYAAVDHRSVYVALLARKGVSVDRSREELVMYDLRVADVMHRDVPATVAPEDPFEKLASAFLRMRLQEVHVVNGGGTYHGLVDIQDVKRLLVAPEPGLTVRDVGPRSPPRLAPDMALAEALPLFYRADLDELPVVDGDGRLVGVLREREIVGAYHREVLRKDALLARIETTDGPDRSTDYLELPEGFCIRSVHVDGQLAGRTLRELRLPTRYKVTVVAVSIQDSTGRYTRTAAAADLQLKEGDRIVVMGPRVHVMALATGEVDREETEMVDRVSGADD